MLRRAWQTLLQMLFGSEKRLESTSNKPNPQNPMAQDDAIAQLAALMGAMSAESGNELTDEDEFVGASGPFGLSVDNPVPCAGVLATYQYVQSLRGLNGRSLAAQRLGSFTAQCTSSPVDGWKLTDPETGRSQTIYVCGYAPRNTSRTPGGFLLLT